MKNKLDIAIDVIKETFNPKSNRMSLSDLNYHIEQLIGFKDEFIRRCTYPIGARVRLNKDLAPTISKDSGWYSYKHFLNSQNVGEVRGLYINNKKVYYEIMFDKQTVFLDEDTEINIKDRGLFSIVEDDLMRVDIPTLFVGPIPVDRGFL